jgi:tripartite-type tricarboxylate transporter receptor subunit TctC
MPSAFKRNEMKLSRRQFQRLAAGAAVLPLPAGTARAQAWPSRPVRFLVGYAPGGGNDIVARLMGQWFSERLGQPFLIENRPGAATNMAAEAVVHAAPDGYTLLLVGQPNAINATLDETLPFNFIRDIAPVAGIMTVPNVMVVHPSFPANTVPKFIGYAKANPGKINMANPGTGTGPHMSGQLFKMMAGVDLIDVPYRGGALALTDLVGGQVQVMFLSTTGIVEPIRAGQLRALAVTSSTRSQALPDVPTAGEFVPGFEASSWQGLGAPKNTPAEIVEKLNGEINAGLADPKIKARVTDLGATVLAGSHADFGRLIADETEKWGKVVKFSGAKPD